jgi:hypothetical protein
LLEDKEQLEDYLILNLNKALNRAANIYDKEIAAVASGECLIFLDWICLSRLIWGFIDVVIKLTL